VHVYSSVFFFLLSARIFARWTEYRPSLNEAAAAIGLMCLSILSFGYGAAGAVTMLVIILLQRSPWRFILAVGLSLGFSFAICFWLIHSFGGNGTVGLARQALTQLQAVFAYVVIFLSAPIRSMLEPVMDAGAVAAISELASILGLFASGLILLSAWRRGIGSAAAGFALSLVTFGLGNSLITALARLELNEPLASRYLVIPVLFWIGLALYGVTRQQYRPERSRAVLLASALSVLSLVANWQVRWLRAQPDTRPAETGETEMALINGVDTPTYTDGIWNGPETRTRFVIEELRKRDWSIFRQPVAHVIGQSGSPIFGAPATGCIGYVDHTQPAAGMPQAIRIDGWAYDMQSQSRVHDIVFIGPDGVIRGVGRTVFSRDDVQKARPEISDPLTGWVGFIRKGGISADRIEVYAVVKRDGHSALCKIPR
jgi:hypothetical protein